jgi:hypothetical protein
MTLKDLPTPEMLRKLLRYDAETGQLIWAKTNSRRAPAGSVAGCLSKHTGYIYVGVNNKRLRAHRVVWMIVYNEIPGEIDHIDGNRSNNRLENLRVVSRSGNNQNRGIQRNNTSGATGVSFDSYRSKWAANIQADGKKIKLGRFASFDEAVKAYAAAKEKFHTVEPSMVDRERFKGKYEQI